MICPSCGAENRDDATFCGECTATLAAELVCAACGRSNPTGRKFCDACGQRLAGPARPAAAADPCFYTPPHLAEKILRDRATLEGKRRTVTVLFADAMGFTPLSERLDDEEVYDLMQGCLARMMDAVHRYEGTITQFTADGEEGDECHRGRTTLALVGSASHRFGLARARPREERGHPRLGGRAT